MATAVSQKTIGDFVSNFEGLKTNESLEVRADSRLTEITVAFEVNDETTSVISYEWCDMRNPSSKVEHEVNLQELLHQDMVSHLGNMIYVTFNVTEKDIEIAGYEGVTEHHRALQNTNLCMSANPLDSLTEISLSNISETQSKGAYDHPAEAEIGANCLANHKRQSIAAPQAPGLSENDPLWASERYRSRKGVGDDGLRQLSFRRKEKRPPFSPLSNVTPMKRRASKRHLRRVSGVAKPSHYNRWDQQMHQCTDGCCGADEVENVFNYY